MQTYTITEVLSKIKTKEDKAYAYKGDLQGSLLFVDTYNKSRITTVYPNGVFRDSLTIRLDDNLSEEESKQWVFVPELYEDPNDNEDMIKEIRETLFNALYHINEQLTEEDRNNLMALIKQEKNAPELLSIHESFQKRIQNN